MKLFPKARGLAAFDLKLLESKGPAAVRPLFKDTVMPLDANKQKLQLGIRQRENVLPISPLFEANPSRIGYAQRRLP